MQGRGASPVTLVNTLIMIFIVLHVPREPTPLIWLQQPARLVLLGHSLVPLDHHRVRYVLWGHTLMKVKEIAHSAPKEHTTLHPEQHRALVVLWGLTRVGLKQCARFALRGRMRTPLDHFHA